MGPSTTGLKCRLLWKLARLHGWSAPVDETTLVDAALAPGEQGSGRAAIPDLLEEPYVVHVPGEGYVLRNDPDSQALAAVRLRSTCGYTDLQIEATLSRFDQAGGFDAYDVPALRRSLDDWV